MPENHVFVETNWVVAIAAPMLSRNVGAAELLERSRREELILHVPAISLIEAHKVIKERSPRADLEIIRRFVHELQDAGDLEDSKATVTFDVLSRFQQYLVREKQEAPERIAALRHETIGALPVFESKYLCHPNPGASWLCSARVTRHVTCSRRSARSSPALPHRCGSLSRQSQIHLFETTCSHSGFSKLLVAPCVL